MTLAFLDNEAVCTVQIGESVVSFSDVGQIRTSIDRLSQDNLHEEEQELRGELQGVLPKARSFEFKLEGTGQVIRGRIALTIAAPDTLNQDLHHASSVKVLVTRVGTGRPRYLLIEGPRRP